MFSEMYVSHDGIAQRAKTTELVFPMKLDICYELSVKINFFPLLRHVLFAEFELWVFLVGRWKRRRERKHHVWIEWHRLSSCLSFMTWVCGCFIQSITSIGYHSKLIIWNSMLNSLSRIYISVLWCIHVRKLSAAETIYGGAVVFPGRGAVSNLQGLLFDQSS